MVLLGGLIDWDGVVVKTPERQYKWFREWARQNNVKFEYGSLEEFLSVYNVVISEKNTQGVYDHFNLPCDMSDFKHPVWPAYDLFKEQNPVEAYDGIAKALKEVWKIGRLDNNAENNRAMRLAVNTTNNWKSIYPDLEKFKITHLFDSFCTAETLNLYVGEGGKSKDINKPSKVSVALMLNILDTRGEATFHLGDTIGDLRASHDVRRHGEIKGETLITVGAAWGFDGYETLSKGYQLKDPKGNSIGQLNFNHIIEHPSQLPGIIKQYR